MKKATLVVIILVTICTVPAILPVRAAQVTFVGDVDCQEEYVLPPELQGIIVTVTGTDPNLCPSEPVERWTAYTGEFSGMMPEGCFGPLQATIDVSGLPGNIVLLGSPVRTATANKERIATFSEWTFACPGEPYAPLSDVPKLVYSPSGNLEWTLTVRDNQGSPLEYAQVDVKAVSSEANELVAWCQGQSDYPSGYTGLNGTATFTISAGGCMDPDRLGYAPFRVRANGIEFVRIGAASPDAVNLQGKLPSDPGYHFDHVGPDPVATVSLSDAIFHTPHVNYGTSEYCSDLDGDGDVGLGDGQLLQRDIANGAQCYVD